MADTWMKVLSRLFIAILLLSGTNAAAESLALSRQPVEAPEDLPGLFSLILIGEATGSDAERVALLDLEGDAVSFSPVMPEYRFKRLGGLTAPAALAEAEKFLKGHCAYNGYRIKSLLLSTGATVGLELVPDYPVALCETGNIVTVGYAVGADGVIRVYTNLILPVGGGLFSD